MLNLDVAKSGDGIFDNSSSAIFTVQSFNNVELFVSLIVSSTQSTVTSVTFILSVSVLERKITFSPEKNVKLTQIVIF